MTVFTIDRQTIQNTPGDHVPEDDPYSSCTFLFYQLNVECFLLPLNGRHLCFNCTERGRTGNFIVVSHISTFERGHCFLVYQFQAYALRMAGRQHFSKWRNMTDREFATPDAIMIHAPL